MKLVRYRVSDGPARFGALAPDGKEIVDFGLPEPSDPLAWFDLDGPLAARCRKAAGSTVPLSKARLLAPVAKPGKIIAIGLNYRDHATESQMQIPGRPMVFSKFTTAVVGPEDSVVLPRGTQKADYEAELAVVIGRRAKSVPRDRALGCVFGYMNLNDVSARDFQFADIQWQRGKSCDTFAPIGPWIATADEIADPHALAIRLRLNGQTMQDSSTSQLIFGVPEIIAFLTETITLEPGDVIATGTPKGVGFARKPPVYLKAGDVMEVEVDGLGVLRNPVVAAS